MQQLLLESALRFTTDLQLQEKHYYLLLIAMNYSLHLIELEI